MAKMFDASAKLRPKRSSLWNIGFLKRAATTLGSTVYIPDDWTPMKVAVVIPHEVAGHVKQFRYAGLGIHPNLGIFPGMFIVYLFLIFPVFLSWGRYRMELHADSKSWYHHLRGEYRTPEGIRSRAKRFANFVSGPQYLYSLPRFWVRWGFERRAEKVIQQYLDEEE
jgi:hypothetical protein